MIEHTRIRFEIHTLSSRVKATIRWLIMLISLLLEPTVAAWKLISSQRGLRQLIGTASPFPSCAGRWVFYLYNLQVKYSWCWTTANRQARQITETTRVRKGAI